MKKLTPVIVVETIEPVLPFWKDRLGFTAAAEVPHEDRLGFVILQRDGVEVMYQSRASVAADVPAMARGDGTRTMLFIEVGDVREVEGRLVGVEVLVPMRQTFYGSTEFWVRAPCGTPWIRRDAEGHRIDARDQNAAMAGDACPPVLMSPRRECC
jgi:uncharacterized glyoxalase superfamily protein PhnB